MAKLRRDLENLVIVPTHGVFIGGLVGAPNDDKNWIGIFPGEGKCYFEHAVEGILQITRDTNALLLFSGGKTRPDAGPLGEAVSYWLMVKGAELLVPFLEERAGTEDYAKNSYSHIPYSVARFKQINMHGRTPEKITICGWKFKEKRFLMYAQDAGWPLDRLFYIGVNNPEGDEKDLSSPLAKAIDGEKVAIAEHNEYSQGNGGKLLEKKRLRNPQFTHINPYGIAEGLW